MSHSAIIIGVGPYTSLAFGKKLASLGWNLALISRTADKLSGYAEEIKKASPGVNVVIRAVDAANGEDLKDTLDWAKNELNGKVEVLNYNAANVAESDLMAISTKTLEDDFKVAVSGMLVAGQWFAENADKSSNPLLLLTSGMLHEHPSPAHVSLSAVKSAATNLSRNFAQILPEKYGVKVGIPHIVEAIIPDGKGGYQTKSVPDDLVREIFMPFIAAKDKPQEEWVRDRIY